MNDDKSNKATKPPFNTKWFKDKLQSKELTQRALAKYLGADPAAVSLMLQGRRKLQIDEAGQIATVLNVPIDEVLREAGVNSSLSANEGVSVAGWVDGQGEVFKNGVQGPRRVVRPAGAGLDVQALRFQYEGAMDGGLVYYQPSAGIDPEAIGRPAIITTSEGKTFVKIVKKGYERGKFNCSPWFGGTNLGNETLNLTGISPILWLKV